MALYTPLPLPWSSLTSPTHPAYTKILVRAPSNPDACTCGRYTFLRACSCIHATVSRPCGRTRTARGVPVFCGGAVTPPPHHFVVEFVVGDECEDHPGYKLRPWPYTTLPTKKKNTTTTTTTPARPVTTQRIIPTSAVGCSPSTCCSPVTAQMAAPMATV